MTEPTTPLLLPERFNVAEHFLGLNAAPERARRPYLYCGEEVLTYGGLRAQVNRAANALRRLGVGPEQRVVLLVQESLLLPVCFWAAVKIGAVAVPLNTALRPADYRFFLDDSRATALLVEGELWPTLAPAVAELRHLRHVVAVGGAIPGRPALAELMAAEPAECEAEPMTPDLPAFWLYTSGSTGRPKAAVHLHRSMPWVVECYAKRVLALRADDLGFSTPKMFFAYGLGNSLYFPPAVGGAAVILAGPPTPARVFEALERFQPTVFYSVPAVYNALLATYEGWLEGRGTPPPRLPRPARLRCCVSAGEWLPPEIYRRWRRHFGVEILDGIGSTEMLHFYVHSRPGHVRPGSTGTPVPGYEAKLVDEQGTAVREGEVGVLLAKGESSAPYYWNNREKTRATMLGAWVQTGDQFHRDADGYFWYHGRADDMLKVGGSWVSPLEVENALLTHPAVAECGVVGLRDETRLTKPKAFVVLREGWREAPELVEALRRHAAERLLPHKVPQWVAFVERLPRTATGKLQRFELRAERLG